MASSGSCRAVAAMTVAASSESRATGRRRAASWPAGVASRESTSARRIRTFTGIASCGFDSMSTGSQTRLASVRGNLVYAYGAIRALTDWRPAQFDVTIDGGAPCRGDVVTTVAAANSKALRRRNAPRPRRLAHDGMLDVVIVEDSSRASLPALSRRPCSKAPRRRPASRSCAARGPDQREPPVHPFADGDPIAELPVTVRVLAGQMSA